MRLKKTTRILGVKPEILMGLMCAQGVYDKWKVEMVVTSCTGDKHGAYSRHYQGMAVDLRSRDIPADKRTAFLAGLRKGCGPEFKIILESDHFHMSYKPQ